MNTALKIKQILFPPKCKCCGKLADIDNLCDKCRDAYKRHHIDMATPKENKKVDFVDKIYASYCYSGEAKKALLKAKFENPASFMNSFMADVEDDLIAIFDSTDIDCIVSVPFYKSKLYKQEYDLPQQMTKQISKRFAVNNGELVRKIRKTKIQHKLPLDERKANLINAFEVCGDVKGKNILIIDDVITSGSTVSSLATELKLLGADKIYVWVYAYNTGDNK